MFIRQPLIKTLLGQFKAFTSKGEIEATGDLLLREMEDKNKKLQYCILIVHFTSADKNSILLLFVSNIKLQKNKWMHQVIGIANCSVQEYLFPTADETVWE